MIIRGLALVIAATVVACAQDDAATPNCRARASAIHKGMTRGDVEKRMKYDGGIMGVFKHERLYFPNAAGELRALCMLNLDFQPHELSSRIFNDDNKFATWVLGVSQARIFEHSPRDRVSKVAGPFMNPFHAD